jgi:hypothetical protein
MTAPLRVRSLALDLLGQAEVRVRLALGIEEDVRGLEVAMENATLVRVMDGAGDRGEQLRCSRFEICNLRFEIRSKATRSPVSW